MADNIEKLRRELIDLIYAEIGGDSQFDREGGRFPMKERAEEIVDDGILALARKFDALKDGE